jgi:toxin-antitoxin system PIN domain toxin
VIAVDTNLLVYAEIRSSPFHLAAQDLLRGLAGGSEPWAIPWPCLYEFLRVVTHPRVYRPPVPLAVAREDLAAIVGSPTLQLLAETERHAAVLDGLLERSPVSGNLIHDAHIAALCLEHGISELWTADADFARFKELRSRNPLR